MVAAASGANRLFVCSLEGSRRSVAGCGVGGSLERTYVGCYFESVWTRLLAHSCTDCLIHSVQSLTSFIQFPIRVVHSPIPSFFSLTHVLSLLILVIHSFIHSVHSLTLTLAFILFILIPFILFILSRHSLHLVIPSFTPSFITYFIHSLLNSLTHAPPPFTHIHSLPLSHTFTLPLTRSLTVTTRLVTPVHPSPHLFDQSTSSMRSPTHLSTFTSPPGK